jgi:hypothetical protein
MTLERLRDLPFAARLSLALLLCVNLGGFVASGVHMREHHANRDEREGLSMTDLVGAYHGVTSRAPLWIALERGHPSELEGQAISAAERDLLLAWLRSERISEDYDNLDLGDDAPAEILAASCLGCHAARAPEQQRAEPFLDYWDDVKRAAFSREIAPTDKKILIASTHTHAIALATTTLLISCLMLLTGFGARLKHGLMLGASAGLAFDLASWWLARSASGFTYMVVAGGALYAGCMLAMTLAILFELRVPGGE